MVVCYLSAVSVVVLMGFANMLRQIMVSIYAVAEGRVDESWAALIVV